MDDKIKGGWPGGPRRPSEVGEDDPAPRLARMDEIEGQVASRRLRLTRKGRRRRVLWGMVLSVILAGGLGWYLGASRQPTPQEFADEMSRSGERGLDISGEVNRTLLELWRMEEVEAGRGRRE